jgi:hypothetical protein
MSASRKKLLAPDRVVLRNIATATRLASTAPRADAPHKDLGVSAPDYDNARKINPMTTSSGDSADSRRRSHERAGLVRLSINLSAETADAFKALIERKGITITEGIRRAITVWKFLEDETAKGNQIAVIEQDGNTRKVVLFL